MNASNYLSIAPLEKALAQLKQSITYYHSDIVQKDEGLILQLRAAAIQAFEFTYELSWKMLKRYLEMILASPDEMKELSFPDLIRTGSEHGLLLSDLEVWKTYSKERSMTSHTYEEDKAEEVFASIPQFIKEVDFLLTQLRNRINQS